MSGVKCGRPDLQYVENDDSKKKQFGSKMVILVVVKCCVHSVDSKTGIICEGKKRYFKETHG